MIEESRQTIINILNRKDPRRLVICGPCSIHDQSAAIEYATELKKIANQYQETLFVVMRTYLSKPRSQGGWKGFINDPFLDGSCDIFTGIKQAQTLLEKINAIGMPCATEYLNPLMPDYFNHLISWAAIGARTVESQLHREMASNLPMPIAFKNNTAGDIQTAVDACLIAGKPHTFLGVQHQKTQIIHSQGNPHSHIILRGAKTHTNYDEKSISCALALLKTAKLPQRVMIDCSHGNSEKEHTKQNQVVKSIAKQIKNGNSAIIGIMLESHLKAGKQSLSSNLTYGKSITDACIDLEETEKNLGILAACSMHSTPSL